MNYEEIRKNFFYYPPKADSKWLRNALLYKLVFLVGKHPNDASPRDWLSALIYAVRDLMTEDWLLTKTMQQEKSQRTMYYLSMEFLMGRVLSNALIAVGMYKQADEALQSLGQNLQELVDEEVDPGLGNGGLGRLAACFLDSIATMKLPGIEKSKTGSSMKYRIPGRKIVHRGNLNVFQLTTRFTMAGTVIMRVIIIFGSQWMKLLPSLMII